MESTKELNQIVKPAVKTADETAANENIISFGVYEIDGTNNKAREINAPAGYILTSYNSKVELLNSEIVNDELLKVRFISKTYNKYSVTTAKHQREFSDSNYWSSWKDIKIMLKDTTAQKLFNAAMTNPEAAKRIKEAAIKQYERESQTLHGLKEWQEDFKTINQPAGEILTSFLKRHQEAKHIKEDLQVLKTLNNKIHYMELNNISFKVIVSYNKKYNKILKVRLQDIKPTYESVLI